jgi:hypothetical protein
MKAILTAAAVARTPPAITSRSIGRGRDPCTTDAGALTRALVHVRDPASKDLAATLKR